MAVTDKVITVQTQRHIIEQRAYTEIRNFLSNQFILEPVLFMEAFKKRPEDLNGADLRASYKEALAQGLTVGNDTPLGFKNKFLSGSFF